MTNEEAVKALKLMAAQVEWEYPLEWQEAIDRAVEALDRAQGQWIDLRDGHRCRCSVCGDVQTGARGWCHYCPTCGAEMEME